MIRVEMFRGEYLFSIMVYILWYIELIASIESWFMYLLVTV